MNLEEILSRDQNEQREFRKYLTNLEEILSAISRKALYIE